MVIVYLYGSARAAAKKDLLYFEPSSVATILDQCAQLNSKLAQIMPQCGVLLNGAACHDFEQMLTSGNQLDILPKFAGG